jgi:SPP1 gp7 family putative phage head morphogenesis protein
MPTPKPKTAAAVHPNAGVEAAYRLALQALIVEMFRDLYRTTKRAWEDEPVTIAHDAPGKPPKMDLLTRAMNKWGGLWVKKLETLSEQMADQFANANRNVTDRAVKKSFAEAGLTIKFRPTQRMIEGYKAVVAENVSLIKSIPAEALKKVEGEIYRAVTKGSDLATLTEKLRDVYGSTYNRAALIARDQNNKAKAVFEAARRSEVGITEAVWMHSHGGAEPRPSHVALDGTKYTIAKGAWDKKEKAWIQPGELINCRCVSKAVMPFFSE